MTATLALLTLLFPPLAVATVATAPLRWAVPLIALAGTAVFFFLWSGPGLLLWLAAGLAGAVPVLRKR